MQRARCYLLGETAVVLELEPPVTLESQKRIWRLAQRLVGHTEVVESDPGHEQHYRDIAQPAADGVGRD
ncbi:allophanate hydrolase 2 subunit 1 [Klebsiella michiganensis]|nr:allophanate hydrolase 2 subunit 1 [Klebsiella michiganensis]